MSQNVIADAVSRSTSPSSVWNFMSTCAHRHPDQWWMESCYPIKCLLTVRNTSVADCLDSEMAKKLQNNYNLQITYLFRKHQSFLSHPPEQLPSLLSAHGIPPPPTTTTPVPAQPAHMCEYAALLARTLQATSIPNCLNIISIEHKESNLPNPLSNNWALQSLLTGIKRVKGQPPAKKLPITPEVLKKNYLQLNLLNRFDASFWAVCLVSFYGMLCKRHLLAGSRHTFDPSQQLVRSDSQIFS